MSLQGKTAIFENCSFFLFTMSAWYSVNLVEEVIVTTKTMVPKKW